MDLHEKLNKGMVICAEGYIFELERRGYIQAGPFVPEVVLEHPDAVLQLHREFLAAGSDIMVALTYYAHREKLKVIGRENDLERMNRAALQMAREVASEGDALLAGNICNTWAYDHNRHEETSRQVYAIFDEQVLWARQEGADLIIAETLDYLGEAEIALEVIKKHGLLAVITFGAHSQRTKDGHGYAHACAVLEEKGASVVGLNCTRGPGTMLPLVQEIRAAVKGPVAALPVTYRTTLEQPIFQQLRERDGEEMSFPLGLDPFTNTRAEMADFALKAKGLGVNYVGVCCGGAPHHVRAMAEALGRKVPASRYSPDMSAHEVFGTGENVKDFNRDFRGLYEGTE